MMHLLALALAGAAGAASRYVVDHACTAVIGDGLPWGTWLVNVTGSLGVGVLAGLVASAGLPAEWMAVAGVGFLGAYTTFSTWMYQTLALIEQRAWAGGAINVAGSLIAGLLATGAGLAAGAALGALLTA